MICQNQNCLKPLVRKRYVNKDGRLRMEAASIFHKRRFCNKECYDATRTFAKPEVKEGPDEWADPAMYIWNAQSAKSNAK
jgi:hypothetical protein